MAPDAPAPRDDDPLDDADLRELPIFPLPDVVLLPGALLPLHVFEQRYRDMTRDVLAGNKLMGVARLRRGFEKDYHGRPPVHEICGVGRVIACDRLADGRYNLLLRGLARIRIDRELPPERLYRKVEARMLPDEAAGPADHAGHHTMNGAHAQLIALCDRLSLALDEGGEQIRKLVRSERAPDGCADLVAAALVADPDCRQKLLETRDPCQRLTMTLDHIGRLLCELEPSPGGMPN
jgi:uncharacterized protein